MKPRSLNQKGIPEKDVQRELEEFYEMDTHFTDGRVLNSMCTQPHPLAQKAHAMFINANLGNPGLCRGTAEMERRVISFLAELYHGKEAEGHVLSGGTESNITALYTARNLTGQRTVIYSDSAHFSVDKALNFMEMKGIRVPQDEGYRFSLEGLKEKITKKAALIFCVAGTTELGVVDPIPEICEIAADYGVPVHVDAAFGGFVLPFLEQRKEEQYNFDFQNKEVFSLSVDPHKMGLATIPSGAFLVRDSHYLKLKSVDSVYLTHKRSYTMLGTRGSAAVAATYAVMRHLGLEGYRKLVARCMANTHYLAEEIKKLGPELVLEPLTNLVCVKLVELDRVKNDLEARGWQLSITRNPESLRLVVMPHITRDILERFVQDFAEVLN